MSSAAQESPFSLEECWSISIYRNKRYQTAVSCRVLCYHKCLQPANPSTSFPSLTTRVGKPMWAINRLFKPLKQLGFILFVLLVICCWLSLSMTFIECPSAYGVE